MVNTTASLKPMGLIDGVKLEFSEMLTDIHMKFSEDIFNSFQVIVDIIL